MTYEQANESFNQAIKKFNPIRDAYVDIKIPFSERPTDAEYFTALKEYKKAEAIYDKAFAEAQS